MHNALTAIATRAALVVALASPLGAHAGLVTGVWDPLFGSFLPGLSYQVRATFFVPAACSTQGDDTYNVNPLGSGACDGATVVSAKLRLYDPGSDPNDFLQRDSDSYWFDLADPFNDYGVAQVRVQGQQVVGVSAGQSVNLPLLTPPAMATFNGVVATALGNSFGLHFTVSGPVVTCFDCIGVGGSANPANPDVVAGTTGLTQVITTFKDNGTGKLVDASGNAIGVRLNDRGDVIGLTGNPVPEPGSLPLVMGALASAAWLRRRKAR